jgi:hypothetical protein
MSDEHLFGIPGSEHMYFDLANAYESQIDPYHDEHDIRPNQIEEWSVCDVKGHLLDVDRLTDWAVEMACDDGMWDEDGADDIANAAKGPDVRAAFEAALDLWASKIKYRMADKCLRTWTITWDANDEPLADGEPIYVKAKDPS